MTVSPHLRLPKHWAGAVIFGLVPAFALGKVPPYQQLLGDEDVAAVATFVRNAWGNHAAAGDTIDVYHVRERR